MRTRVCTGASFLRDFWTRCLRMTAPAVRPALLAPVRAPLVMLALCAAHEQASEKRKPAVLHQSDRSANSSMMLCHLVAS